MKKIRTYICIAALMLPVPLRAYAEISVGTGPETYTIIAADYVSVNASGAVVSASPYSDTAAGGSSVGANHAGDQTVTIDLGFTLVSPAVEYGGFKVAEGSVRLSDGSWATIGYDSFLRSGYYKLKREVRDSGGVDWYVVEAHASNLGDYYTPDGSVITELWLKKSDCTAKSSITINTTDETRANIVKTALSLLGKAYQYGASGPDAFDCSGFTTYVLSQCGITGLPRTSTELCSAGTDVGIRGLLPGDIVGRPGHVGIYIGDGWFIHSSQTVTGVICESVDVYNTRTPFTSYRSVV